jgi:hypothetical protein
VQNILLLFASLRKCRLWRELERMEWVLKRMAAILQPFAVLSRLRRMPRVLGSSEIIRAHFVVKCALAGVQPLGYGAARYATTIIDGRLQNAPFNFLERPGI